MRRYDIVSGIILILSIIDFSLAVPVLVQKKRQAGVDVVHIPIDVITVLGKRGEGELGHVVEDYFKTWEKPKPDLKEPPSPSLTTSSSMTGVSGDTHSFGQSSPSYEGEGEFYDVPLDSPPSESSGYSSDRGSKWANWHEPLPKLPSNPAPDPIPLTDPKYGINLLHPPPARPGLQKELPNPNPMSSTESKYGISLKHPPPARPASQSKIVKVPESQVEHIQQPKPGPSADPDFDWDYWTKKVNQPPPKPASLKSSTSTKSRFNWKYWANPLNLMDPMVPGARPPSSKPSSSKPSSSKPSTDSGVTWKYWLNPMNLMDPLVPGARLELESSKSLRPKPSGAGPSIAGPSKPWTPPPPQPLKGLPKIGPPPNPDSPPPELNLEPLKRPVNEVVPGPPTTPDSELYSGHPSSESSANFQLPDLPAAIYAAKGKAKQLRRVSGSTRDVGNAAE